MKYEETVKLINQKVELIQEDVYTNPLKYLKDNKIDLSSICSNLLRDIKKNLATSWIDKSDLEDIIKNKKIILKANNKKKNPIYTLIDKKGHEIEITNEVNMSCGWVNNEIRINIFFPISGDFLEFNYLFENIKFHIPFIIDVSNLTVYLALANNTKFIDDKYLYIRK